jgi:tetratricopeptide (TPR) repeat protein
VGVLAIAIWATVEQLLDVPPVQFWVAIAGYLAAAEALWTYVDRQAREKEARLPRQGLVKLTGRETAGGGARQARWFFGGGRPRPGDITTGLDASRECFAGLLAGVCTQVSGPRVHVIEGPVGAGRSTLLLRLGKTLADEGQVVYYALADKPLTGLAEVLKAAARKQCYLLIDDLELRPEAAEVLYQVRQSGLPLVVVVTCLASTDDGRNRDLLQVLEPADLLSLAKVHAAKVTANDLASLSRTLEKAGRLKLAGVSSETGGTLWPALRQLQGLKPHQELWSSFDAEESLSRQTKLALALAGVAELALPVEVFAALCDPVKPAVWQRAGLVAADGVQVLTPVQPVCLDLLNIVGLQTDELGQALLTLLDRAEQHSPALAPRLLLGLARCPQTRPLALATVRARLAEEREGNTLLAHEHWQAVLDALDLSPSDQSRQLPAGQADLAASLFRREAYEQALALYRELTTNPVYAEVARFNMALTLTRLGRAEEAAEESARIVHGPRQTVFLKAIISELRGDYVAALDLYEAARKSDVLPIPATRQLALTYLRSGAPRAALPLFEALLSYTPLQAELYGGLAVAHLHSGMAQRAAAQSSRAIQAGVEPDLARKAVAQAFLQVNASDRAAVELEACVAYAPEDVEAWDLLAEANRCLGRYDKELECLHKLQELQPTREMRLELARCVRDQGQPGAALELLKALLAEGQQHLELYLLTAVTASSCDDYALQQEMARQALALNREEGWAHFWLADSLTHLGTDDPRPHYRVALECFRRELKASHTHRQAATLWQAVQVAAEALGEAERAREAAREAWREGTVCAAIGVEIMSVTARRSVPPDVFLDGFPGLSVPGQQPQASPAGNETPSSATQPVSLPLPLRAGNRNQNRRAY